MEIPTYHALDTYGAVNKFLTEGGRIYNTYYDTLLSPLLDDSGKWAGETLSTIVPFEDLPKLYDPAYPDSLDLCEDTVASLSEDGRVTTRIPSGGTRMTVTDDFIHHIAADPYWIPDTPKSIAAAQIEADLMEGLWADGSVRPVIGEPISLALLTSKSCAINLSAGREDGAAPNVRIVTAGRAIEMHEMETGEKVSTNIAIDPVPLCSTFTCNAARALLEHRGVSEDTIETIIARLRRGTEWVLEAEMVRDPELGSYMGSVASRECGENER